MIKLILFCLLILIPASLFAQEQAPDYYSRIFDLYNQYIKLENQAFERLTFKLADDQSLAAGRSIKFVLEDNLGRIWIFKPFNFNESEIKLFTAYHMYILLGLDTARIYAFSMIVNGQVVNGYLRQQEKILGYLDEYLPKKITQDAWDYIVKSHVVDWMINNYNVHKLNYYVLNKDEKGNALRISRSNHYSVFLTDEKPQASPGVNTMVFLFNDTNKKENQLYAFWNECHTNKALIDINKGYSFVKILSLWPQSQLDRISYLLSEPDIKKKKENLDRDFKRFLNYIGSFNHLSLEFFNDTYREGILENIINKLKFKIELLQKESLESLDLVYEKQPSVEIKDSLGGHMVLEQIYWLYWIKNAPLLKECPDALDKLLSFRLEDITEAERIALDKYIAEAGRICSGKKPSYRYNEINKVLESNPSKKETKK